MQVSEHRREFCRQQLGVERWIDGLRKAGEIDPAPWITHCVALAELPGAFPGWLTPESRVVKAMLEL